MLRGPRLTMLHSKVRDALVRLGGPSYGSAITDLETEWHLRSSRVRGVFFSGERYRKKYGSQSINETLAKDQRHASLQRIDVYSLDDSSSSPSQVRVTSQVRVRFQFFFSLSLLFISSDCYSRNDVQVVNFQVCNILHYRSLELLWKHIRHPFMFINFLRRLRPVVAYV